MGNVLLARILEYFNGTLFLDDNYRFCVFFIENYIDFYKMTLEEVVEKSKTEEQGDRKIVYEIVYVYIEGEMNNEPN